MNKLHLLLLTSIALGALNAQAMEKNPSPSTLTQSLKALVVTALAANNSNQVSTAPQSQIPAQHAASTHRSPAMGIKQSPFPSQHSAPYGESTNSSFANPAPASYMDDFYGITPHEANGKN